MAMLVHTVCGVCGERVRPRGKTSKLYVHLSFDAESPRAAESMADWRAAHPDAHDVTSIRMVTVKENY